MHGDGVADSTTIRGLSVVGPVAQTLMQHDLLDELRIWLHPVLVGSGNLRDLLFRDGSTANLRLVRTRTFGSGLVVLVYRPITGSAR